MRIQNCWSKTMSNKQSIAVIILCILGLSWLSYTIIDQQKQIEQLKQELQQEQFKYKMLYRDPIVREAIESGG
jgi:anaerobic C4-dicarboxylate transporter